MPLDGVGPGVGVGIGVSGRLAIAIIVVSSGAKIISFRVTWVSFKSTVSLICTVLFMAPCWGTTTKIRPLFVPKVLTPGTWNLIDMVYLPGLRRLVISLVNWVEKVIVSRSRDERSDVIATGMFSERRVSISSIFAVFGIKSCLPLKMFLTAAVMVRVSPGTITLRSAVQVLSNGLGPGPPRGPLFCSPLLQAVATSSTRINTARILYISVD